MLKSFTIFSLSLFFFLFCLKSNNTLGRQQRWWWWWWWGGGWGGGHGSLPPPLSFSRSRKKKGKQRKKRKSFKAETIKRLSSRSKCYCFSQSRSSIEFKNCVPCPLLFEINFAAFATW